MHNFGSGENSDAVVHRDHNGVIEQRLAEDEEVQGLVDADFLEDGQNGDWIHGRDECRECERFHEWQRHVAAKGSCLAEQEERGRDEEDIDERACDGVKKDGAQIVEEDAVVQRVGRLEDDGRQKKEEEDVRAEGGHVFLQARAPHEQLEQNAENDEDAKREEK